MGGGSSYGVEGVGQAANQSDLSRLLGNGVQSPWTAGSVTGGLPNVQSMFPLKKAGVPWDPNTDWYGYPDMTLNSQNQFPPPSLQGGGAQGYRML